MTPGEGHEPAAGLLPGLLCRYECVAERADGILRTCVSFAAVLGECLLRAPNRVLLLSATVARDKRLSRKSKVRQLPNLWLLAWRRSLDCITAPAFSVCRARDRQDLLWRILQHRRSPILQVDEHAKFEISHTSPCPFCCKVLRKSNVSPPKWFLLLLLSSSKR